MCLLRSPDNSPCSLAVEGSPFGLASRYMRYANMQVSLGCYLVDIIFWPRKLVRHQRYSDEERVTPTLQRTAVTRREARNRVFTVRCQLWC